LKISKDNVIEVFVDALEGVNIQTCIAVSREIESSLNRDEEDFELTVSSAGIGYPFKVEQQYQKNLGKSVEIKLNDHTKLNGILLRFTPEEIVIEQEEKKNHRRKQTETIGKNRADNCPKRHQRNQRYREILNRKNR
jgi:ribosome maturation factor RimP